MSVRRLFTPSSTDAEVLDAATVGRTDVLDTLAGRIRSAARDGSRPHTLVIAAPGAGKTHTCRVAAHRALTDPDTAKAVLAVPLSEDALGIGSYADLLVEIARGVGPELGEQARALRRAKDPVGIEALIVDAAAGRMVLLLIDNLGRVFDGIGASGQGSMRAWVETSAAVTVLATAPALFPGVSSREYPWYGSFMIESLPPLTDTDAAALLRLAARHRGDDKLVAYLRSPDGGADVAALHRVVGGAPRMWHLLSECADPDSIAALTPAVEALLDRLAPQLQQRLGSLPTGEQRLVVELARGDGPRTVSELAAAVGVSNQSASAALGRLAAEHWVRSAKADGDRRTSWYDLTDPMLRRYVQFRDG